MRKCWAKNFSECEGKISREHLITKRIFEQNDIYVQGFDWCRHELKKISVSNTTSKILCQKHNSELSPVDIEGANAVKIFESTLPINLRSNHEPPEKLDIDGYLFERWLLKTAINISYKRSNLHIGVGMRTK